MEFKIGEHYVFTDEFKSDYNGYSELAKLQNAVFISTNVYTYYVELSLDGKNPIAEYHKNSLRKATEKEIIHNTIKRKFII